MNLRNIATFVKVARLGSFHAASQQLHATQPAISARIASLEEELGVKLFARDKSGSRLTARGTQLLPYAEKLLAVEREMKDQVQQEAPEKGVLRIGIADTLAHLWLSPLLKRWQQQYPLVSFELTSDVTPELRRQLLNHQLDLALMVTEGSQSSQLVSEPLCSYPQIWVGTSHLIGKLKITEVQDLVGLPILSFPRETQPWHFLQQLFSGFEEPPVVHTCSSVANLIKLCVEGVGLALIPRPLVAAELASGQLVAVESQIESPALSFCYSWRLDDDRLLPRLLADSSRDVIRLD